MPSRLKFDHLALCVCKSSSQWQQRCLVCSRAQVCYSVWLHCVLGKSQIKWEPFCSRTFHKVLTVCVYRQWLPQCTLQGHACYRSCLATGWDPNTDSKDSSHLWACSCTSGVCQVHTSTHCTHQQQVTCCDWVHTGNGCTWGGAGANQNRRKRQFNQEIFRTSDNWARWEWHVRAGICLQGRRPGIPFPHCHENHQMTHLLMPGQNSNSILQARCSGNGHICLHLHRELPEACVGEIFNSSSWIAMSAQLYWKAA